MRVLGIDCGTEHTGYGVIDSDGVSHHMVAAGVITTRTQDPLEQRLHVIARGLREIIEQHHPVAAAVEEVFHSVNAKSALKLAHVRGVALLMAAETGLEVGEYSPLEVKMSVVGYGRAEKSQVELMVRSLLGARESFARLDVSDALAVAICHATSTALKRKLGTAV